MDLVLINICVNEYFYNIKNLKYLLLSAQDISKRELVLDIEVKISIK